MEKVICQLQAETINAYKQVSGLTTILQVILNKLVNIEERLEKLDKSDKSDYDDKGKEEAN